MSYVKDELVPGYVAKFVIHQHFATNEHFDLRIEFPVDSLKNDLCRYTENRSKKSEEPQEVYLDRPGIVLRSWVIPKHKIPSTTAPLLATETENHNLDYEKFEGIIPKGNYGAGRVKIFDKGTCKLISVIYDKKYVFDFKGKKLKGLFALIKIKGKKFLWLKIKNTNKYNKVSKYEIIIREIVNE